MVLGIGNRLRADDAVGSIVAEAIVRESSIPAIDAGEMPDNFVSRIWELAPETIIFIDACDFGGKPGEVRVFDESQLEKVVSVPVSTHQLPLPLLLKLIRMQKAVAQTTWLVGVQPQSLEYFTEGLSPAVQKALPQVRAAVDLLCSQSQELTAHR